MKKIILILFITGVIISSGLTSNYSGVNTAEFLRLVPDARTAAMGRSSVGLADCAAAVFYNPAGLLFQDRDAVSFTHHALPESINKGFLSVRFSNDYIPYLHALSLFYIDYGSIPFEGYDPALSTGTTYSSNEFYINMSFAKKIIDDLSLGANLKLFRRQIYSFTDESIAVDLTFLFKQSYSDFSFGGGFFNIGPRTKLNQKSEQIPTTFIMGLGYTPDYIPIKVTFDVIKVLQENVHLGLGTEYAVTDYLKFRMGYNSQIDIGSGFGVGFGLNFNDLSFDYAFEPNSDVNNSHYITISYLFGPEAEPKQVPEKEYLFKKAIEAIDYDEEMEDETPIDMSLIEVDRDRRPEEATFMDVPEEFQEKFITHTLNAREFYEKGEYEIALLEIKFSNEILFITENLILELKLLIELGYIREAKILYDMTVDIFPRVREEIIFP